MLNSSHTHINALYVVKIRVITHADGSGGVRFSPSFVCLFFSTMSQKPMLPARSHQTWHTNVAGWDLETHLFEGKKVKGQRSRSRVNRRGSSHSC